MPFSYKMWTIQAVLAIEQAKTHLKNHTFKNVCKYSSIIFLDMKLSICKLVTMWAYNVRENDLN